MLTLEQAQEIAARELERLTSAPPLAAYHFDEMWCKREEEPFWVFAASSQQLQDAGYVPGAVYVLVDKRDGHLWSDGEQAQYYTSRADVVRAAQASMEEARARAAEIRHSFSPYPHSDSAALLAEDRQR